MAVFSCAIQREGTPKKNQSLKINYEEFLFLAVDTSIKTETAGIRGGTFCVPYGLGNKDTKWKAKEGEICYSIRFLYWQGI
jgi:hypothetical protein